MTEPGAAPTPGRGQAHFSRFRAARARRHSVLRRRTDQQRDWLRVLVVLGLIVALAVSALVGLASYQRGHAAFLREAASLHKVQATVLKGADPSVVSLGDTVQVRWTDVGGTTHQASAVVPSATPVGGRVPLWIDAAGHVSRAPTDGSSGSGVATGSLTLIVLGVTVGAGGALLRGRLDDTDQRNWEREWQRVEPAWTHRR